MNTPIAKCCFAACALILLFNPLTASAETSRKEKMKQKMQERFAAADSNSDGTLSKEEFMARHNAKMEKKFTFIDANADGNLSKDELRQAHQKRKEQRREKRDAREKCRSEQPR